MTEQATQTTETSAPAETKGAPEVNGVQGEAGKPASTPESGGEKPGKASTGKADPAADPAKPDAAKADPAKPDAEKPDADKQDTQKRLRDHIAKYGLVPEKIEDYGFKPTEKSAAWFTDGENDPLAKAALEVAHKHGLGKMQAAPFINDLVEAVATSLDLMPTVDVEAERTKLLPRDAQGLSKAAQDQAIDARMTEAHGFLKTLEQSGLAAGSVNALVTIMDTADGVKAIEFLKSQMKGDGLALGGGASAAAALAELEVERASERYRNDPVYRVDVQQRILRAQGKA